MAPYNRSFDNRSAWPLDYEGRYVAKAGKMKRVKIGVYQVPVSIGDRLTGKTYSRTGTIRENTGQSPAYYGYASGQGLSRRILIRGDGQVIDLDELLSIDEGSWRV